jgi:coproporphyrinogen III oxidase-like Fe-S oxidoreductase
MEELFGRTMADFEERGLLDTSAGRLRLTDAGLPVADHLLRALVRSLPDPLTMRPRRAIF